MVDKTMTELEILRKNQEELKLKIEAAEKKSRARKILDDIKNNGFKNPKDPIVSYEELLAEYEAGNICHEYKGVVFETFLDFQRENIYRKVKIIEIKNWEIFQKYHRLLRSYEFGQEQYYDYSHNFSEIPFFEKNYYSDGSERKLMGSINYFDLVMKWTSDERWTCRYAHSRKVDLKRCYDDIAAQIDLIEKIGNQETDIRDKVLKEYSDYQLEYELKKRSEVSANNIL